MARLFRRRDDGVSDIVGTALVLTVTVVLVGAATLAFTSAAPKAEAPPEVAMRASASATDSTVTLDHVGGADLQLDDLEAVVSTSSWSERVPVSGSGAWSLGGSLDIPLTHTLAPGERIDVLLVSKGHNAVVAESTLQASGSSAVAAAPGFTITVVQPVAGAPPTALAGGTLRVEARIAHPDGRKAIEMVYVDMSSIAGSPSSLLYDDGTHGDVTAGDGSWSAYLQVPPNAPGGAATLPILARDLDGHGATSPPTISINVQAISSTNGVDGTDGSNGATGATGFGIPGGIGATGDTGAPGMNGAPGTPPTQPAPVVSGMSPSSGPWGQRVRVTGSNLIDLAGVTMALTSAPTTGYSATFAPAADALPGAALDFTVPYGIPEGDYVVRVTNNEGSWMNAPGTFAVTVPNVDIADVQPDQAKAYEQVKILGSGFLAATSVVLTGTSGEVAVPWTVVSDGVITFVTHPGINEGTYDVTVSNGYKSDTDSGSFTALPPISPGSLHISPTSQYINRNVIVTGDDLASVTRLTLRNQSTDTTLDADWLYEAGHLRFRVPVDAAPPEREAGEWVVMLSGQYGNPVAVPDHLMVLPVQEPSIRTFLPIQGEPFTQIDIYGENFVNVQSVRVGTYPVVWASVDEKHLIGITHAGIPPGSYPVNVTTATGCAESTGPVPTCNQSQPATTPSTTFKALPLKLIPVYDTSIFSYVAVATTVDQATGKVNVTVKAKLANPAWSIVDRNASAANSLKCVDGAESCFFPEQTGNANTNTPVLLNKYGCTGPTYVLSSGPQTISSQYDPSAFQLYHYVQLIVKFPVAGSTTQFTYKAFHITTNDYSQFFNVPATVPYVEVLDHNWPASGFNNCGGT